jgi:hypothetical protein
MLRSVPLIKRMPVADLDEERADGGHSDVKDCCQLQEEGINKKKH